MNELDEIMAAERCGKLEAGAFDLRLRELESREREDRLTRLVAERPDLAVVPASPTVLGADAVELEQLRRQVTLLAEYQHAVVNSRGWRVVQILRRLLGRAW
jgi:hypothetical protein